MLKVWLISDPILFFFCNQVRFRVLVEENNKSGKISLRMNLLRLFINVWLVCRIQCTTLILNLTKYDANINETYLNEASTTSSSFGQAASLRRRVCYFANWAPYREVQPPLYPDQIEPDLCTHIHYAFAKIDPISLNLVATEEHDMKWTEKSKMPLYIRLYSLKRRNPALKILLAVGGLFFVKSLNS